MKYWIAGFFVWFAVSGLSAFVPEPAGDELTDFVVEGGRLHIGNGDVVEDGLLVVRAGKIAYAGDSDAFRGSRDGLETIEATGNAVYPGFILLGSDVGLWDIGSIKATIDTTETGLFNPEARTLVAYNTDSEIIATLRYNGILTAQTVPQGGLISGRSSVMKLDGWTWEDAVFAADEGVHFRWPRKRLPPRWWRNETTDRVNEVYDEHVGLLKAFMEEARAYAEREEEVTPKNLKMEACGGLFDGSQTAYLHASSADTVLPGLVFLREAGVKRIVLFAERDVLRVVDYLKAHEIPVVIPTLHRLPDNEDDGVYDPYELPKKLAAAGVRFAISDMRTMSRRNLAFHAGTAAAHGLEKERALQSITLDAARVLGLEDRLGSLETGKEATFFISEGDALDMRTNQLKRAWIGGREIELPGKQQFLYERFSRKFGVPAD